MGFYDVSEYAVGKCHEANVREAEKFWKHVGIWLYVKSGKRKNKR